MPQRTRIINDPAELVPLFQAFSKEKHIKIFKKLRGEWISENELKKKFGEEFEESIKLFKSAGLVKSNWSKGENGPEKEFTTSYSDFRANFDCSIEDIAELVSISLESDAVLDNREELIKNYLKINNRKARIDTLSGELSLSKISIRALAKRSSELRLHGNKLEIQI